MRGFTGLAAGTMVMLFITFEAPLSGMSMNPARSFASDFVGMQWNGIWIYFVAPVIGMMTAAEVFVRTRGHPFRDLRQAEPFGERAMHFPLRLHDDAGASAG